MPKEPVPITFCRSKHSRLLFSSTIDVGHVSTEGPEGSAPAVMAAVLLNLLYVLYEYRLASAASSEVESTFDSEPLLKFMYESIIEPSVLTPPFYVPRLLRRPPSVFEAFCIYIVILDLLYYKSFFE